MLVHYRIHGQSDTIELADADLPAMLRDIEQHLRERHPELSDAAELPSTLADNVLNALADNQSEILLGDLAEPA